MAKKPPIPASRPCKPPLPNQGAKYLPPWETGTPAPVAVALPDNAEPTEAYDFSYVHPKTQAIRRLFVAEFVKDFSMAGALARLGFNFSQPNVVATRWLREPFTAHVLDQYIRAAEDDALITRQQIIAGLNREANNYGLDATGASRVSAYSKLAKILGMQLDRKQVDVRVAGGIMLVPVSGTVEDWERDASRAQLELKQAAKV